MGHDTFPSVTEAVVSQTVLASSDSFLAAAHGEKILGSKIGSFFDLLNLLDTAVWYEKLWYISGARQSHASSRLTKLLTSANVLGELDPRELDPQIGEAVADWLLRASRANDPRSIIRKVAIAAISFGGEDQQEEPSSLYREVPSEWHLWTIEPSWAEVAVAVNEQSAENLAATIIRNLSETATGRVEQGASLTRTVFMWALSQHKRTGICVEATRVSIMSSLFESLYTSLGRDFYSRIAKAFNATADELFAANRRQVLHIPPLAALVLNECCGGLDLGEALLKVRRDMQPLREQVAALERSRQRCRSLKELVHEERRFKEWLVEMAEQFSDNSDVSIVERGLPHVGEFLKPLAHPEEIATFSADLIAKPIEAARRWWIKRPASYLFSLKNKLFEIKDYCNLARKAFDVEFTSEEMSKYRYYSSLWEAIPFSRLETYRPKHHWRE